MKDVKVIAISAKQGGGKTSLAEALMKQLPEVGVIKFAKPLYEMHEEVLKVIRKYGYDIKLDKRLLQLLGTEWGRNHIDNDIWVNCLKRGVDQMKEDGTQFIIIDDMRFKNEFEGFDCIKIRLECDEEIRKARCSQWRDTSTHQSEIDLDDWVDRFDLVIDTGIISEEDTFKQAMAFIASLQ